MENWSILTGAVVAVWKDRIVSEFLPQVDARPRLPLRRPTSGARVAGVCRGLSLHLRIDVKPVRLVMALLALAGGIGIVLYVFLWITVPAGDPRQVAHELDPNARLAKPLVADDPPGDGPPARVYEWVRKLPLRDIAFGAVMLTIAALLIAHRLGFHLQWSWVFSVLVVTIGLILAWGQLDSAQRGQLLHAGAAKTPKGLLRLVGGLAFVIVGILLLVGQESGQSAVLPALLAVVAVLLGAGLVLAPWWLRLMNQLGEERASSALARERAEIAAHLHDSVLQTLALIQRSSDQPGEVTRLARNQERELRAWLYNERTTPGTSVADEARHIVATVEDALARAAGGGETISIELVVVGDSTPNPDTDALLAAMAEALKNAVRHGKPPVSAYLEVRDSAYEAFVTDRGDGFDLKQIAPDRFGVRESMIGRIERRGGTVKFRTVAAGGTEVAFRIPRANEDAPQPATPQQRKTSDNS